METTEKAIVNIISLPHRTDRRENANREANEQGFEIKYWDGIVNQVLPFVGVAQAHIRIVQAAKMNGLDEVIIGEDDLKLTAPGAWQYYLDNKPKEFDLYLAGIYNYHGVGGTLDGNNRVKDFFCGMTLYTVPSHYYDQFLATRLMNHIDRELSKRSYIDKFIVCNPMVVMQSDGFSDLKQQDCKYGDYLKGKPLFGINN